MRDSVERDLAVANELGCMADARIKELETHNANLQGRLKEVTAERDALLKEVAASENYQAGLVSTAKERCAATPSLPSVAPIGENET